MVHPYIARLQKPKAEARSLIPNTFVITTNDFHAIPLLHDFSHHQGHYYYASHRPTFKPFTLHSVLCSIPIPSRGASYGIICSYPRM